VRQRLAHVGDSAREQADLVAARGPARDAHRAREREWERERDAAERRHRAMAAALREELDQMLDQMREERRARARRDTLHREVLLDHNLWDVQRVFEVTAAGRTVEQPPPLYPPGWWAQGDEEPPADTPSA
jgi:hypothetical protein